jgi:hypothetical protein
MSEIKFACPHCSQHIACPQDYADMCIVCPGCGKPMMVPRLSAKTCLPAGMVVVASSPTPKPRPRQRIPTLTIWTEDQWARHTDQTIGEDGRLQAWSVSTMGAIAVFVTTLMICFIFDAAKAPAWIFYSILVLGAALSVLTLVSATRAPGRRLVVVGVVFWLVNIALIRYLEFELLHSNCGCGGSAAI